MAESQRIGSGTRALLGLPPENSIDQEKRQRAYLRGELRKLNEIIKRFSETTMPEWWRAFRKNDDPIGAKVITAWAAATVLRSWLRKSHPDYWDHRRALDLCLAELSVSLASNGTLRPKKRRQLKEARIVANQVNRGMGDRTREEVQHWAAKLQAEHKERGEKPLPYRRLLDAIASRMGKSVKTVEGYYPKSLHT
jgi:hypothetical protein